MNYPQSGETINFAIYDLIENNVKVDVFFRLDASSTKTCPNNCRDNLFEQKGNCREGVCNCFVSYKGNKC